MVSHLTSQSATRHRWHGRIEHYTPSGTAGRILFVLLSGSFGLLSFALSLAVLASGGLIWVPLAVILAGVGLTASLLTAVMLWLLYLSLIDTGQSTKAQTQEETMSSSEERRDSSLEVVKRQYTAGNISEMEFERRVENLLHADAEFGLQPETASHRNDRDAIRETD